MSSPRSMQSLVQEYLGERRRLGFSLAISGTQLMTFARFVDHSGNRGPLNCRIILEPVMNFIPVIDLVAAASCYGAAWKDGKAVSDRISK